MEMGRAKILREIQMKASLTRDKISRYRGILKLHARDKKLQQSQATKLKYTVSRKLASLAADVERDREIVNELSEGDKQRILGLLSDHREFHLAHKHLRSSEIHAAVYQDNHVKCRLLDKLYYKKKERLKRAIELELERSTLSVEFEERSNSLPNCEQQRLIARLQQSITKHNTAKAIRSTYYSILNILKQDAIFFDTLLNSLKGDQSSQCKTMLRVTVMGQLAAENLDDVRQKYKRMTCVILRNMKIRERTLDTVHCQVQDLWAYAQSLVRVENDYFAKKDTDETSADKILENQLIHLEDVCDRVKDIFLVRQYQELLLRLEDQSNQKTTLLARLNANIKNRDLLLSKKNQAVQILEILKHSTKPTAEQYKVNGHETLEQIELEKKRKADSEELREARGKLLIDVRAALHSMSMILLFVKPVAKAMRKIIKNGNKDIPKEMIAIDDKEDMEERDALLEFEEEANVLVLLAKITRKIGILFAMSNFDLEEQESKAQSLYRTYVSSYNSNLIFGTGEEEAIGLLVEHEVVDVTVPTRADIKLHSRQIIEARLKPE